MLPEDEKLLKLAELAHLPWIRTNHLEYGPALWNDLREFMARWEATLERSIVPARWQAEIEYAQCAANAVPRLLKRIEALRKALGNCLYADGNAGEAQCAVKAAERALAADEAAAKEQV